jgi:catechol 2,3-dioxygenase-like lactoylglutathione lyase family enzyme
MAIRENKEFELQGINHLALTCRDMAKTVDFYTNVLGMPLTKTLDLPFGSGQHFFFDIGNGDSLAFFWFPDSPDKAVGVAAPSALPGQGPLTTAHGAMNHVAFNVPRDKIEEYREKLAARGIDVTEIMNHDNSPTQVSETLTDDVFVRSLYFFDPDGILLEFACWERELGPEDTRVAPATAEDAPRYREILERAIAEFKERAKQREQ